jgi:hypothetical protein
MPLPDVSPHIDTAIIVPKAATDVSKKLIPKRTVAKLFRMFHNFSYRLGFGVAGTDEVLQAKLLHTDKSGLGTAEESRCCKKMTKSIIYMIVVLSISYPV